MKNLLTFDVGTTNSRIRRWTGEEMKEEIKISFGVKDGSAVLEKKLAEVVESIRSKVDKIDAIIASGMITSNLGLCEIPHIETPVTMEKLARGMEQKELFGIPAYYITGIKTSEKLKDLNLSDVIRGEEVEVYGILKSLDIKENSLVILPGTHNKFILVNENKEIVDFTTTISGEMLQALTNNTILRTSLDGSYCKEIDYNFLEMGFKFSRERGFGKALFSLRTLDLFNKLSIDEKASYLLGIVIQNDVETLYLNKLIKNNEKIILGGAGTLTKAFGHILKNIENRDVIFIEDGRLSALGALEIAKINSIL